MKTYEIELEHPNGSFARINREILIFPSFHLISNRSNSVKGRYRVRQVDMFDRTSQYSDILNYF